MLERFRTKKAKEDMFELDDPNVLLKKDGYDDCLSCRVLGRQQYILVERRISSMLFTGSTAFVALGGYTYFTGMKNLRAQRQMIERSKSRYKYGSRQLGILSLSATLIGLGLYRTFN
jgi:hypothetical protein